MSELTPRDDVKKRVSEILKRVDQLIKGGSIDQAMREVINAKEIDPKNVYVLAYEERLAALREEFLRQKAEEARRKEEEEEKHRKEEAQRKAEEERRRAEQELREAEAERRKAEELRKKAEEEARRKREVERLKQEEALRRQAAERKPPPPVQEEPPSPGAGFDAKSIVARLKEREIQRLKQTSRAPDATGLSSGSRRQALTSYRMALQQAWADGATDEREEAELRQLRSTFSITSLEHSVLEREVKLESYAAAFKRAWASGVIDPAHASSLADLRTRFAITQEEHDEIETSILWDIRASQQKAKILVIDDDRKLLGLIQATLLDAGFDVKAVTTSDEAYRLLREYLPDLILSDINLETSTMGGFTFYEKVRELEIFNETPFLFLSGLTDEVLVRTGKELGVDDYITKPFSNESLIATIRGKLKRYGQIRKSRNRTV